jgi:hypothetical protein
MAEMAERIANAPCCDKLRMEGDLRLAEVDG